MQKIDNITEICTEIRKLTLGSIYSIGKGHVGGCMSIVEVLAVLYYELMKVDPDNPKMEGRDRLVVSKGHAGPAVYAALASKGYFPREQLLTLNKIGTDLPSHCDMNHTTGIDMTTGSLGQGFSCAVGVATGSQIKGDGATIYTTTFPCSMCSKILINAGIKEIVYDEGYVDDLSKSLLNETDIIVREFHPAKRI